MSWLKRLFGKSPAEPEGGPATSNDAPENIIPPPVEYKFVMPEDELYIPPPPIEISTADIDAAKDQIPFPILEVAGKDAHEFWESLREEHDGKSSPFVLGGKENLIRWSEEYVDTPFNNLEETLKELEAISGEHVLKLLTDLQGDGEGVDFSKVSSELLERWEAAIDNPTQKESSLSVGWDNQNGGYFDVVYIALLPTAHAFEIPAYLRMGGWNDMPKAAQLCAVFRLWGQRHDAVLIGGSYDYLELSIGNPPTSREAVVKLAVEQMAFNPDQGLNGYNELDLANHLLRSKMWGFWWD